MSIMNSMIFKMIMGGKDDKTADSPFDKYKVDAKDNPFGQSSSDQFVNFLLQGGEKPQYSLGSYGQGFFNGGGLGQDNGVPLSMLSGSSPQANNVDVQALSRKYPLSGNDYFPLRYMR